MAKLIDAKDACCLDTLSKPVDEAMASLGPNEVAEVRVRPGFRKMVYHLAQEKGYAILEEVAGENEVSFKMKKEGEERKKENCMVCGGLLEYMTEPIGVICIYCRKEERGYIRCPRGHYVCEACHGKGAYEAVKDLALSVKDTDPLAFASLMMAHPSIPMLGCENALVAAAAFMTSLKNRGCQGIEDKQIIEAMDRTQRQAITPFCGLTGVCGVPIAIGAGFSIVLGAECPKDRETSITMHAVSRVVEAIANDTGPCCCKSYVWTGLTVGSNLAKEYLGVKLPIHRERVVCSHFRRHPHGCLGARCGYFPKRAGK